MLDKNRNGTCMKIWQWEKERGELAHADHGFDVECAALGDGDDCLRGFYRPLNEVNLAWSFGQEDVQYTATGHAIGFDGAWHVHESAGGVSTSLAENCNASPPRWPIRKARKVFRQSKEPIACRAPNNAPWLASEGPHSALGGHPSSTVDIPHGISIPTILRRKNLQVLPAHVNNT